MTPDAIAEIIDRAERYARESPELMACEGRRRMKRRGQGEGTLYQRPDGKWMAQIDLGWRDGKRVRRSLYAPTRREVVEKLKAARRAIDAGLTPTSDRMTVAAYLTDWLDATRATVRPSTWTRYRGMVRTHHAPRIGRIPLSKLTPGDVERMLRGMADAGLSARTCHHARAILRTALARAVAHGLILRNPAALAAPPRVEHREVESWDAAQVRTFLESVRGHRLEALFTIAVVTGLRQGELLGLRWSDIDLATGTLTVRHALQRVNGRLELVETKTPRSRRTIPLPELALRALRTAQDGPMIGTHLFTTPSGSPLYGTAVYRDFLDATDAAGLPRIRFHSLRHTAASLLLAQGTHPRVVMEMLGHSTIALTMNTYSHVIPALEREAADTMNAILTGS